MEYKRIIENNIGIIEKKDFEIGDLSDDINDYKYKINLNLSDINKLNDKIKYYIDEVESGCRLISKYKINEIDLNNQINNKNKEINELNEC